MFWVIEWSNLSSTGAACDHISVFGLCVLLARRQRPPRAAFSSSPTSGRYGVDQCLAREKMRRACRPVLLSVADFAELRPTAVSTRTKSRDRFPSPPATLATMPVAINTSPLSASAEAACRGKNQGFPATPAPRKRRTLPREAAM